MGLLMDIGIAAAEGALRGALHPFVVVGDITSQMADEITAGAGDLFQMFEAGTKHPAGLDIRSAIRGLFDDYVTAGDTTPAKADEITGAIMNGITLAKAVLTPKQPSVAS